MALHYLTSVSQNPISSPPSTNLLVIKRKQYLAALSKAEYLKHKEYEFTTPGKVFAKRFEAFGAIQHPPPLVYNDFVKGSDFHKVAQNDLIVSATECFQSSKATADKLVQHTKRIDAQFGSAQTEELRRLVKVSVSGSIYLQRLRQKIASSSPDATVTFDFDTHKHYCIIKLV
uniref:NAA35-like TPR repeats domain-containing protein n=1 Tax=Craspedostauros australis TaxID=1486917 RepID=A0A7R9WS97_9STRA|mmetsp:Transcript_1751/g.4839  ORF Transcript_1751/g.4839 Transcript_1751/m.4839 type:complete len:173 (+) Transcript_1751:189-707(+)